MATAIDLLIGTRVKAIRRSLGWTQEEFGEVLGRTKSCISQYENGRIEFKAALLEEIAKGFQVPLTKLLDEDHPYSEDEMQLIATYRKIMDPEKKRLAIKILSAVADEN